jgi:Protein of unknown function (DUF1161)
MKLWIAFAALLFSCGYATGQDRKSCEDLKAEIVKKLEAKGVTVYSLDVVDKGKESTGKVVGGCDGGTKNIVYQRTAEPAKPEAAKAEPSEDKKK